VIRLAALLCIFAFPVLAQNQDHVGITYTETRPDELVIRESSEGHFAEIWFWNSDSQSSSGGNFTLTWEGEEFAVRIRIGGADVDFAEIITVEPPPHLMAMPDYQEVPDGEGYVIQIVQGLF
jgi:hypothetical protein